MPVTHKELDISVCEVQDLSKVKNIKNTAYMSFPYIMYKVSDLLPVTPEVLKEYNELLYKTDGDDHVEYLVFKYIFDIHYINPEVLDLMIFLPSIKCERSYHLIMLKQSIN